MPVTLRRGWRRDARSAERSPALAGNGAAAQAAASASREARGRFDTPFAAR